MPPRPSGRTAITEIATGLGALGDDLAAMVTRPPLEFVNVPDDVWDLIRARYEEGADAHVFAMALESGAELRRAQAGLRGRPPALVEWKSFHRPPGFDVMPVDLRIDHVYQVSCKYGSQIMQNAGPSRLFDRLLADDKRDPTDWFGVVAPRHYQRFYEAVREHVGDATLPPEITQLTPVHRRTLKEALSARELPPHVKPSWMQLSAAVAAGSAERWARQLGGRRTQTRLLWRLLRIGDAPYFVLGANRSTPIRLRVASAWDWLQQFELQHFVVRPRAAGQPEVAWHALVVRRLDGVSIEVQGHVEVRWSHGRLQGAPEAKIYLETPHSAVPGYFPLD